MISAIWGILVWNEFHDAGVRVKCLLAIMFIFSIGSELHRARASIPLGTRTRTKRDMGGRMTKSDNENAAFGQPGIDPDDSWR